MTPQESNQLLVQFAAPASPWWLLLLVPAAGLAAWWLYRRDLPTLSRPVRAGLVTLRIALLVMLVFLAFRPNIVRRVTLTYPGRIIFAVDDSRSMLTRDDRISDPGALRIARTLADTGSSASPDADAPLHLAARQLDAAIGQLHEFERFARTAERGNDQFWDRAGKAQTQIEQSWARVIETAGAARPLIEKLASPSVASQLAAALARAGELRADASTFFVGEAFPGHKAFDTYYRNADALADQLLELQSALDQSRLTQGDPALLEKAAAVRLRTRLDLTRAHLTRLLPSLSRQFPNQAFELLSTTTGQRATLDASSLQSLAAHEGVTDLTTRLQALADEPSEFPLSGVVLLSDGQDVAGKPLAPLAAAFSRRQTPVLTAGVGEPAEPTDLAIIDLAAPPIALADMPATITAVLKVALDRPTPVQVQLTCLGKTVSTLKTQLQPGSRVPLPFTFTPDQAGIFRYTLKITPENSTEVFPSENNSIDFILNVRKEPVRVLLIDFKPRWETRFALNILQRMPYVQLNPVIALTQKEQPIPRGVQRGSIPDSAPALALYDLIILGETPPGLLTDAEWTLIQNRVEKQAGTVAFLSPRTPQGQLTVPDAFRTLLPTLAAPAATQPAGPLRASQLTLTAAGTRHPLSLALAPTLAVQNEQSTPGLRPAAQSLITGPENTPLLSWQRAGTGKSLLLDSSNLWLALNPAAHRAHTQLFVELVTWAIEAGPASTSPAPSNASAPQLFLDSRRASADQGLQLWAQGLAENAVIEAVADDKAVAQSTLKPTRVGATLARADFPTLPAKSITLRAPSDPALATPVIHLTAKDPELYSLARNDAWLGNLASATGGEARAITQLERLLQNIEPRQRVEKQEFIWRLWDSPLVLAILVIILTVEWVWRKFAGLV